MVFRLKDAREPNGSLDLVMAVASGAQITSSLRRTHDEALAKTHTFD
jgi:hypothetical protein